MRCRYPGADSYSLAAYENYQYLSYGNCYEVIVNTYVNF